MTRRFVEIILSSLTLALLVWDIYLWRDETERNTISAVMRTLLRIPVVALVLGGLIGHWMLAPREETDHD